MLRLDTNALRPRLGETLWVTAVGFIAVLAGFLMVITPGSLSPFGPSAGIFVALAMLRGYRVWLGLWIGSALALTLAQPYVHPEVSFLQWGLASICVGIILSFHALLCVFLSNLSAHERFPFYRLGSVLRFIILGAVLSTLLMSAVGVTLLDLLGLVPKGEWPTAWADWWVGRGVGILLVTPLIVSWRNVLRWPRTFERVARIAIFGALLCAFAHVTFLDGNEIPLSPYVMPYLLIPFLIWAAMRWELPGVMATLAFISLVSVEGARMDVGPFLGETLAATVLHLQVFLGMMAVSILTFVALLHEWKSAEGKLRRSRDQLELKVLHRTKALRESEQRYRDLVHLSPDGILVIQREKIVFANDAFVSMLEAERREEVLNVRLEEFLPPDLPTDVRETIVAPFPENQCPYVQEARIRTKSGRVLKVDLRMAFLLYGNEAAAQMVVRDVTERKAAEDALKDREARFRALAETIPQMVWALDERGELEYVNHGWRDYTGLTLGQTQHFGWIGLIHPEDRHLAMGKMSATLRQGSSYEMEIRVRDRVGRYRWFLARGIPYRDRNRKIAGWFGTLTDIDLRKQQDQERTRLLAVERQARAEAERVNRAKDLFLATLSHELRTPLSSILAWSQLLRSGRLSEEKRQAGYDIIEKSARAQSQLIEDMLDMSRIIMGKLKLEPAPVELNSVIEDAVKLVRPQAEARSLHLELRLSPDTGYVIGDRLRLQQVMINLLTNSIKFTGENGRVSIEASHQGGSVRVRVIDTGKGIEKDFLPHLFGRFTQSEGATGKRYGGLGLGLAIVRQLVEMHGGSIQAESEGVGKGAIFTVELPAAEWVDQQARQGHEPQLLSPHVLKGLKILLVDDHLDSLEVFRATLTDLGAEVCVASNAKEGCLKYHEVHPDLLISDLAMPGEDGYGFLKSLREQESGEGLEIRAIALTAYSSVFPDRRSQEAGFERHFSKPIAPDRLAYEIARLTRRAA